MADIDKAAVEQAIAGIREPHLDADLVSAGAVRDIRIDGGTVAVDVCLGFPAAGVREDLQRTLAERIRATTSARSVDVAVRWEIISHAVQRNLKPLGEVKNVIAVASAKGGVGKSTTAANLALALAAEGARAGLLDADIYGPSQPRMMGLRGQTPASRDGKSLEPLVAHDVACMSIGFLIDEDQPMVWRGPMVTQALTQLINDTNWGALDYLVVDMPPGTGDIQLTLAQRVPVSGAVIVTTPQEIALLDARKGLQMFRKVEVAVLGVVENMSTFICPGCGHAEAIFGAGGGEALAAQYEVPFLGGLPLDRRIREEADGGVPSVVADPDGPLAHAYRDVARRTAAQLARTRKDYSKLFPKIVVEE